MEEMYGQMIKIMCLEKFVMILENKIKVLIWGVCFVCIKCNLIFVVDEKFIMHCKSLLVY